MRVLMVGIMVGIFCSVGTARFVARAGESDKLPKPKVVSTSANADPGVTEAILLPARRSSTTTSLPSKGSWTIT